MPTPALDSCAPPKQTESGPSNAKTLGSENQADRHLSPDPCFGPPGVGDLYFSKPDVTSVERSVTTAKQMDWNSRGQLRMGSSS